MLVVILQVDPTGTVVPAQVSEVTLKLDVLPLSVSLAMCKAVVPVFFNVTVWAALVDSAGVENVSADELSEIADPEVATPESGIDCVPLPALSVSTIAAEYVPAAIGAKLTVMLHDAPAVTVPPQVVDWVN